MVDARHAPRRSQRLPGRAAGPRSAANPGAPSHGIAPSDRAVQLRQALRFAGTRSRTWDTQVGGADQEACAGRRRTGKPPENRKPLAPENAGRVGFDLVQRAVNGTRVEIVVTVPVAVAVSPLQAPVVGIGAVAHLSHAYPGPFGQVRVPRRAAVKDGDRVAAHCRFDADLMAKAGWHPGIAILADLGDVGLWRFGHPTALEPVLAGQSQDRLGRSDSRQLVRNQTRVVYTSNHERCRDTRASV